MEADLLLERADHLALIEAKAGQTVTRDMLSPALRIAEVISGVTDTRPYVIYAGDTAQQRREVTVLPWHALHEDSWVVARATQADS